VQKLLLYIFIITISSLSYAQTKFEKEERIKTKEVPKDAIDFINTLEFDKKVKWYKETAISRTSIEAKTKHDGKKYSIEFSIDGEIEDVEITVKWKAIHKNVQDKIILHLQSKYETFDIYKVQIQYVGNKEMLLSYFKNNTAVNGLEVNYEIIINTRVDKSFKQFEFLFSETGSFKKTAEIVLKNTDNIDY